MLILAFEVIVQSQLPTRILISLFSPIFQPTVFGEENNISNENPNEESPLEPTISHENPNEEPLEPISKRRKIADEENDQMIDIADDDNDSEISVFRFSNHQSGGVGGGSEFGGLSEFGGRSELSLDNTVSQNLHKNCSFLRNSRLFASKAKINIFWNIFQY